MDKPIQVGDLVMVVRWEHVCEKGYPSKLGHIFRVAAFERSFTYCPACLATVYSGDVAVRPDQYGCAVSWLKRIPPLEDLQTWRRTEETTA